jgi:hypothetical protein
MFQFTIPNGFGVRRSMATIHRSFTPASALDFHSYPASILAFTLAEAGDSGAVGAGDGVLTGLAGEFSSMAISSIATDSATIIGASAAFGSTIPVIGWEFRTRTGMSRTVSEVRQDFAAEPDFAHPKALAVGPHLTAMPHFAVGQSLVERNSLAAETRLRDGQPLRPRSHVSRLRKLILAAIAPLVGSKMEA